MNSPFLFSVPLLLSQFNEAIMKKALFSFIGIISFLSLISCTNSDSTSTDQTTTETSNDPVLDKQKKDYWYNNEAELSSYELKQARYGEIHEGKAVLVYVTEPFSKKSYTKSDSWSANDVPVIKLNVTKKFNTGIYPYSMMTSTFVPFSGEGHSLKVSSSVQEWCGHAFMELENKGKYKGSTHSYFQDENHQSISLDSDILEDELWSKLRLNPDKLPTGELKVIPSFFYVRLLHKELKAYKCVASKTEESDGSMTYSLNYPDLDRTLSIHYGKSFPYQITAWEENYVSGWGAKKKRLETTATLIKSIKGPYWEQHNLSDAHLRKELGLE